jgi:hypothetical protein
MSLHSHFPRFLALTPESYLLSGEAADINFAVFGLTGPRLKHTLYRTPGKQAYNYITNVVFINAGYYCTKEDHRPVASNSQTLSVYFILLLDAGG